MGQKNSNSIIPKSIFSPKKYNTSNQLYTQVNQNDKDTDSDEYFNDNGVDSLHVDTFDTRDNVNANLYRKRRYTSSKYYAELLLHNPDIVDIFDNLAQGIIITDREINILYVNDLILKMFGYTRKELFSQSFNIKKLMTEYDSKRHDSYVNRYIFTGEKRIINSKGRIVNCVHKSGRQFLSNIMVFHRKEHFITIFTHI